MIPFLALKQFYCKFLKANDAKIAFYFSANFRLVVPFLNPPRSLRLVPPTSLQPIILMGSEINHNHREYLCAEIIEPYFLPNL